MNIELSNHGRSLQADVQRRYIDKISIINSIDPYTILKNSSVCWTTDLDIVPEISYPDIFNYLVLTKSAYTCEEFKAFKSLEAYNFFVSGWVNNAKWVNLNEHILVVAEVTHSQRLNNSNLLPWIILKPTGVVVTAHCNCIAGLGECCSHVGALLFFLQFAYIKKVESSKSVTDVPAYWVASSSNQNVAPQKISSIDFSHPKSMLHNKTPKQKSKTNYVKKLPFVLNNQQNFSTFLTKLESINSNAVILKVIPPFNSKFKSEDSFPKSLTKIFKPEYTFLNKEELVNIGANLDFSLTEEDCSIIESLTKLQSQSKDWFMYRCGRVTASKVKDVYSVKSCDSNISLIKTICYATGSTFKVSGTEWGINHENDGRLSYIEKSKNHHINLNVSNSGLIIHSTLPFMAASPDGIVSCDCCGRGCIEIKCPYSLTTNTNIANLVYLDNGHLKKNHQYFYQVQTQMLLCGVRYCDFVIWSPNENCYIERIFLDDELCEEIVSKSKKFFHEAILPELLGKYFTNKTQTNTTGKKILDTINEGPYKFCFCRTNKKGKMLMCTHERCPNLYYHYSCLNIKCKPSTKKWKCELCSIK